MSKQQPQKRDLLHAQAQRAYIRKSGGIGQTKLLFSITDFEWIAWYLFLEKLRASMVVAYTDAELEGKEQSYSVFGHRTHSLSFKPKVPRRVDDFAATVFRDPSANWNETTQGQLSSLHVRDQLRMTLTPFLDSSPERFSLLLKSENPLDLPARYEFGFLFLLEVEKFSAASLNHSDRFRKIMLL